MKEKTGIVVENNEIRIYSIYSPGKPITLREYEDERYRASKEEWEQKCADKSIHDINIS